MTGSLDGYEAYGPILQRFASLAEELAQETFYRAIEHSGSFRGECRMSVWLCQIGKNCWLSHLRKAKRQTSEEEMELAIDPQNVEEELLRQDTAWQIHKRLHVLPEPYREVFTLRIFAELSFAQIGELFAKSETWARVTYHRAKLKLKEDLL